MIEIIRPLHYVPLKLMFLRDGSTESGAGIVASFLHHKLHAGPLPGLGPGCWCQKSRTSGVVIIIISSKEIFSTVESWCAAGLSLEVISRLYQSNNAKFTDDEGAASPLHVPSTN